MKKNVSKSSFRNILVPTFPGCDLRSVIAAAQLILGEGWILLAGMVSVPEGESLSMAALPVRKFRQSLKVMTSDRIRLVEPVQATHNLWAEIQQLAAELRPDLMLLGWPDFFEIGQIPPDALQHPPCDLGIVAGKVLPQPGAVLTAVRGGPYAELVLRLSFSIQHNQKAAVTVLHVSPSAAQANHQDIPFRGLKRILAQMPEIKKLEVTGDDPVQAIVEASQEYDLVVMGASARSDSKSGSIGPLAEKIVQQRSTGVIVLKTKRPAPPNFESEEVGQTAISVLVDRWFAENNYHAKEFRYLERLVELKRSQGTTISLALPALNEEETVGKVIRTIKEALFEKVPLLDEIVLIDSNSTDRTREIAKELGIPVYIHQDILPEDGVRRGKGEALWKSLLVTRGDIVLWIDTDIVNIQPHFVYGLIGPLLLRPEVQFVKGFYQRPLKVGDALQAGAGGRVTELTARPLLNLFYPELSGVIQPLSGEYGGRRGALEQLPFSSGYGVEIGLLIDVLEKYGIRAIAQVDLEERIHYNQPLEALSKMSFAILQTVVLKLERRYGQRFLEDMNRTMKLIRYEPGRFFLDVEEIDERQRPPMLEVKEYQQWKKTLPARAD